MRDRLYLIDGMSHVYRAYYAIRGLTDSRGRPTNAVYGFTNMLRKLISEEKPEFLGVAVDLGGPTVRHEVYEKYKATRRPMPEDLSAQIPYVLDVCRVLNVPVLSYQRYEADDVIGTLARKAVANGLDVVIVTIDKDMLQLVTERITILDTRSMARLDIPGVEEKFGVLPDRVVDVLSLVGDTSDNIPGAPGIGEKGAVQLISQYGSLESLLENRSSVQRKTYRESLQENEEQILASRELLRIHCDLPVDLDLGALRLSEPDREEARKLFTELDFVSLLEEFLPANQDVATEYEEIDEPRSLAGVGREIRGKTVAVAVALSADEGERGKPVGLSICAEPHRAYHLSEGLLRSGGLPELLRQPSEIVVHDLKPLVPFFRSLGADMEGRCSDTMLAAYLLNPNQNDFSLKRLSTEYLQYKLKAEEGNGNGLFDIPGAEALTERADVVLQLHRNLKERLEELKLRSLLKEVEVPLAFVLADMERTGVRVDVEFLKQMSVEVGDEIDRVSERIFSLAGQEFNLNSPKQLAFVLFEKMNLPIARKTRKAGHYATGVEVLESLAGDVEIAQRILDYRELSKLKNTYLDTLPRLVHPDSGRIHTSYNQMVASTGRLSSSNPNLQNIPIKSHLGRKIRRAFVAKPGFQILAADYSQIELRVMAHLSEDPVLIDAFQKDQDIHERTAREVFGMNAVMDPSTFRRHAKVVNFGIMYGLSAFGLAQSLKIDRREAQQFIDDYFSRYQGVKKWIEQTLREAREEGYVKTLFGRIRPIPEIRSKNWNVRSFGERTAINAPIQGTSADLIKMAMVSLHRSLREQGMHSRLILQVHDELVIEVEDSELETVKDLVRREMESVAELRVPLKVDLSTGPSWYDAK